ncbi:MAG: ABC transporter permease, partial [Alphaproteobacteria bacterium]
MAIVSETSPADAIERKARARRRAWKDRLPPLLALIGIILLWQGIITVFGVPTYISPSPGEVVSTLISQAPNLWRNFVPTALESLAGFFLGNLVAVLIAIAFVHNRTSERAFYPIAVFINTIPIIAIAPILVLIFGNGFTPKVIISGLICFFPTLVNMVRGLRAVSPQTLDL